MTTFADLNLPLPIVQELSKNGITEAFPIQEKTISDILSGKDVLGRGPTGSGKTYAFGLPMLARLTRASSKPMHPRGLILAPTRELANQIMERLEEPARALGLRVLAVVGGVNINRNIRSLATPVDILVATPGRAQDLINQKKLFLDQVSVTTLDEADQMADMGFLPQVKRLLDLTGAKTQRLLFSATLDGDVGKLIDRYMHNPVEHSTAPATASVDTMSHYKFLVGDRDNRSRVLLKIAARDGKTILFLRTKHGVDRQVKKLRREGINAMALHGGKGQTTRTKTLTDFANGSLPVLVATDIAARGIDIDNVSLVVHVDPPAEHKAYLHRAGRTARAGSSGTVVTLVTDEQIAEVRTLFKKANVSAKEIRVTENSPELIAITGAKKPSGIPLLPPNTVITPAPKKKRSAGKNRIPEKKSHTFSRRKAQTSTMKRKRT